MAIEKNVGVTVICLIYNHEKYLERCLDGFIQQKTDFPFEVILHDDCSTDGSSEIVRRYSENYKDIFVPIIEETNQYSKGRFFVKKMLDEASGEYIALCEGDDYWCDPLKLQKQYDYMNKHEECSMCVHNTVIHDLSGVNPDKLFWDGEDIKRFDYLNEKHIFDSWIVHTSSYLFRNSYEIRPEWSLSFWSGDYVYLSVAFANGKIGILPDVMSVYNLNNPDGVTFKNTNSNQIVEKTRARSIYLEEYLTHFPCISEQAKTVINNRIKAIDEYSSIDEFYSQMQEEIEDAEKTDIEKFEWLVRKINSEAILKYCTDPSDGMETRFSKVIAKELFEMVDNFCNKLTDIGYAVHFSFVTWLSQIYKLGKVEKEYILGIAASPENTVGWGIKLSGPPENHLNIIKKYADPAILDKEQIEKINQHKNMAVEAFEKGDIRLSLEEVNKGLELSPLDRDLIYYKAFLLLNLEDWNSCLNEIGIYMLFFGEDGDIDFILGEICGVM